MGRIGNCRRCMYAPVARGAIVCPNCAVVNPNPSFIGKWFSRLLVVVFIAMIIAAFIAYSSNG